MDATRPFRDEADLRKVLTTTLDRLDPTAKGLEYRLVGTAAALLQGVDLPTGDIDILYATRDGIDAFAAAMAEFEVLQAPVWLAEAQQYFAAFTVDGVGVSASTVEWADASGALECGGRGPWQHYVEVRCGRHVVPAVALELRLVSEVVRERPDRLGPIVAHLRRSGVDRGLLERAMLASGVGVGTREEVMAGVE